jgi:hypothetical protein
VNFLLHIAGDLHHDHDEVVTVVDAGDLDLKYYFSLPLAIDFGSRGLRALLDDRVFVEVEVEVAILLRHHHHCLLHLAMVLEEIQIDHD